MALAKLRQGLGLVLGLWLSLDKGLDSAMALAKLRQGLG